MRIFRYNHISTIPHRAEIFETTNLVNRTYGEYIVDDSNFVPMSEAVKHVTGGALSDSEVKAMYDFPNGEITKGFRVPLDRRRGFTGDIAEVSKAIRDSAKGAQEELLDARRQFDFEQRLNELNGSSESSTNSQ